MSSLAGGTLTWFQTLARHLSSNYSVPNCRGFFFATSIGPIVVPSKLAFWAGVGRNLNIARISPPPPGGDPGSPAASAAMSRMKIVIVQCDDRGDVDVADLKAKAEKHSKAEGPAEGGGVRRSLDFHVAPFGSPTAGPSQ